MLPDSLEQMKAKQKRYWMEAQKSHLQNGSREQHRTILSAMLLLCENKKKTRLNQFGCVQMNDKIACFASKTWINLYKQSLDVKSESCFWIDQLHASMSVPASHFVLTTFVKGKQQRPKPQPVSWRRFINAPVPFQETFQQKQSRVVVTNKLLLSLCIRSGQEMMRWMFQVFLF